MISSLIIHKIEKLKIFEVISFIKKVASKSQNKRNFSLRGSCTTLNIFFY